MQDYYHNEQIMLKMLAREIITPAYCATSSRMKEESSITLK
jgi:hypothetical protein